MLPDRVGLCPKDRENSPDHSGQRDGRDGPLPSQSDLGEVTVVVETVRLFPWSPCRRAHALSRFLGPGTMGWLHWGAVVAQSPAPLPQVPALASSPGTDITHSGRWTVSQDSAHL